MANPYLIKSPERVAEEYQLQGRNPEHPDDGATWENEFGVELVHATIPENILGVLDEEHKREHHENKTMRLTDSRFIELN